MNPNNPQGFGRPLQPDIDDLLDKVYEYGRSMQRRGQVDGTNEPFNLATAKQALYQRLAAEAVVVFKVGDDIEKFIPLSNLAELMGVDKNIVMGVDFAKGKDYSIFPAPKSNVGDKLADKQVNDYFAKMKVTIKMDKFGHPIGFKTKPPNKKESGK